MAGNEIGNSRNIVQMEDRDAAGFVAGPVGGDRDNIGYIGEGLSRRRAILTKLDFRKGFRA